MPVVAQETLPVLRLDKWREPFSDFIRNTHYQHPQSKQETPEVPKHPDHDESKTITVEDIQARWEEFIEYLEESNQSVLRSHLAFCTILGLEDRHLQILCKNAFTYETLQEDAPKLTWALSEFFQTQVVVKPVFDKDVAEAHREKSPKELFEELAETNEVVKYLIREFGAELMY